MKNTRLNIVLLFIAVLGLSSCGGGSSSKADDGNGDVHATKTKGYLIDSPIAGVTYICGDGETGTTTITGEFSCETPPVTFKIGGLVLGTLNQFTADKKVYPQDLVGVPRTNFNDPKLVKLVRLLQSLDADGKIDKEIIIPPEVATNFGDDANDKTLEELATLAGVTLVSDADAIAHLKRSMNIQSNGLHDLDGKRFWLTGCNYSTANKPEDDSYALNIFEIAFKNGKAAYPTSSIDAGLYLFPYDYVENTAFDLSAPDGEEIITSSNIGGGYYRNALDSKEIIRFWNTKAEADAYIDEVTSKRKRTCKI